MKSKKINILNRISNGKLILIALFLGFLGVALFLILKGSTFREGFASGGCPENQSWYLGACGTEDQNTIKMNDYLKAKNEGGGEQWLNTHYGATPDLVMGGYYFGEYFSEDERSYVQSFPVGKQAAAAAKFRRKHSWTKYLQCLWKPSDC